MKTLLRLLCLFEIVQGFSSSVHSRVFARGGSSKSWFHSIQNSAVSLHPSEATGHELVGPSHGIFSPNVIQAMKVAAGPDCDDELGAFFTDFSLAGPMASMHHLGKPGVASRLSVLMGEVTRVMDRRVNSWETSRPSWGGNSFMSM